MFDFKKLLSLFIPGKGKVERVPNRLAKGYLKKSIFRQRWVSVMQNKQGECEKARRLRQIKAGTLKPF